MNQFVKLIVFFISSSTLLSCTSTPEGNTKSLLIIDYNIEGTNLTEGDIARVRVTITNNSKDYVLLAGLYKPGSLYTVLWQSSRNGKVEYDRKKDEFIHFKQTKDTTGRIFNSGFLLPKESREINLPIRLVDVPIQFAVDYLILDVAFVRENIYFVYEESDAVAIYRKATKPENPPQTTKKVIYAYNPPPDRAKTDAFRINTEIKKRERGFESLSPESYTFSLFLDSWIVVKNNRVYMYKEKNLTELCQITMETLFYLDLEPPESIRIEFANFTQVMFEEKYKVKKIIGASEISTYAVFLKKQDILKFLLDVKDLGFKIALNTEKTLTVFR